jgi:hypothetical protein
MTDRTLPDVMDATAPKGERAGARGALSGGALGLMLALIVAIAALAATVIGVLVACAALIARMTQGRRAGPAGPPLLEGRRAADGWVAERPSPSAR